MDRSANYSRHAEYSIFSYFFSELKIHQFYLSPIGHFDIADPSSMQDACHHELSKYDLAHHESPSSSVVRASDRCTEGHGFDSRRGLRFFLCPTLARCWIFHLFLYDAVCKDTHLHSSYWPIEPCTVRKLVHGHYLKFLAESTVCCWL